MVNSVLPLADGKVLIAGEFTLVNGVGRAAVARLNADGSLDTSFVPPSSVNGAVRAMAIDANGAILIGGDFTQVGGLDRDGIARLGSDGALDANFMSGGGTGANGFVSDI